MFTRDELDTIIAACDAGDRIERIVKVLGLDVPPVQRAHMLLLKEKAGNLCVEIDKQTAAKKAREEADVKAGAMKVAEAELSTHEA